MVNFGKKLKDLRKENDLSQKELAELIHMSRQAVSMWEININEPSLEAVRNICRVLKISADELLELDL